MRRVASSLANPGLTSMIEKCENVPLEYKVPNVLKLEHPQGYFRTEYLAELKRAIRTQVSKDALEKVESKS